MRPIGAVATLPSLPVVPMVPGSGLRHTRAKGRPRDPGRARDARLSRGIVRSLLRVKNAAEGCTLHPPNKVAPAAMVTLEGSFGSGLGPWGLLPVPGEGRAKGRGCTNEEEMGDLDCRVRQSCLQHLEAGKGRENRLAPCCPNMSPGSPRIRGRLSPEDGAVCIKASALCLMAWTRLRGGHAAEWDALGEAGVVDQVGSG